jgi:predicted NUDIX family NTP pyrophosphohydrolase
LIDRRIDEQVGVAINGPVGKVLEHQQEKQQKIIISAVIAVIALRSTSRIRSSE